ncbi:MAG: hypothetical protein SFU84_00285 [Gemmatimonadales bacterium]|nr:hypothetical protein [Gemmatimonadales bacterium]
MIRYPRSTLRGMLTLGLTLGTATACAPAGTEPDHAMSHPTAPQVSLSQAKLGPEAAKALAAMRNATAAFHDVDAAIAAGYADPSGIPCAASPAGTMGVHAARGSAIDGVVVPNEPEVLLYLPKKGGGFKLVGVEYLVPAMVRNTTTNAVTPWFSQDPWGAGYTLVTPPPSVFGQTFEGPMPGHEPGMPWHYDKHVWVWETNPSGMFSQWNPSISCP